MKVYRTCAGFLRMRSKAKVLQNKHNLSEIAMARQVAHPNGTSFQFLKLLAVMLEDNLAKSKQKLTRASGAHIEGSEYEIATCVHVYHSTNLAILNEEGKAGQ